MPARPASSTTLVLQREGRWVLWSHRGSKGKRNILDHWDARPDAIRESLAYARRLHPRANSSFTPPRQIRQPHV